MNSIDTLMNKIKMKEEKLRQLTKKMAFSMWVELKFPGFTFPVFSAVLIKEGKYYLRIRDSEDNIELIDFKKVPKNLVMDQPNIRNLYYENSNFRRYVGGA